MKNTASSLDKMQCLVGSFWRKAMFNKHMFKDCLLHFLTHWRTYKMFSATTLKLNLSSISSYDDLTWSMSYLWGLMGWTEVLGKRWSLK